MPSLNTLVDWSGTTSATISTSTMAAPRNPQRNGFYLQNNGSATIWLAFDRVATAAPPSISVTAGSLYETPPNGFPCGGQVNVLSASASQAYSAGEW